MTRPNSAEIIFVVDRSGSMSALAADMRGGFDTMIEDQRKVAGECRVTLARFDDQYELVFEGKPIADVPPLELVARGGTALYDAVGRTIAATGERFAKMAEEERPSKVYFVIVTDGEENQSREHTRESVFEMITKQQTEFSWEFIFLGANQDAFKAAADLGIHSANAVNYAASAKGGKAAYRAVSSNLTSKRQDEAVGTLSADYEKAFDEDGAKASK